MLALLAYLFARHSTASSDTPKGRGRKLSSLFFLFIRKKNDKCDAFLSGTALALFTHLAQFVYLLST